VETPARCAGCKPRSETLFWLTHDNLEAIVYLWSHRCLSLQLRSSCSGRVTHRSPWIRGAIRHERNTASRYLIAWYVGFRYGVSIRQDRVPIWDVHKARQNLLPALHVYYWSHLRMVHPEEQASVYDCRHAWAVFEERPLFPASVQAQAGERKKTLN